MNLGKVRLIEIELFSYCNRTCGWCPNKDIDRLSATHFLNEDTYLKILNELKIEDYLGAISYSRYNEPFSQIEIFKQRVQQAKELLPNVKLVANTNGDFMSKKNLKDLHLDELSIMDYDNKGILNGRKLFDKLDINITKEEYPFLYGRYNQSLLVSYYADWTKHHNLTDRGGNLVKINYKDKHEKRFRTAAFPCKEPTHFIGIDYNGLVVPCCEIRSDSPRQASFVLGNSKFNSLKDIYHSNKATVFRDKTSKGEFNGPCAYCTKPPGRYTSNTPSIKYGENK